MTDEQKAQRRTHQLAQRVIRRLTDKFQPGDDVIITHPRVNSGDETPGKVIRQFTPTHVYVDYEVEVEGMVGKRLVKVDCLELL